MLLVVVAGATMVVTGVPNGGYRCSKWWLRVLLWWLRVLLWWLRVFLMVVTGVPNDGYGCY